MNPIVHFISSVACTKKYTNTIGRPVKITKTKQRGMLTTHTKTESNKKVMSVFPPERTVKYTAFINALDGKNMEATIRNKVAKCLISSVVLYMSG